MQLVKGILILAAATQLSVFLDLNTTHLVLQTMLVGLVVAIPVIFQPELRRALEHLGRGKFFVEGSFGHLEEEVLARVITELVQAVDELSDNKIGALIVLEREVGLKDFVETGIKVEARVSHELLVNIFIPNTPLHDGATIVRGERLVASACFLPLAEGTDLPISLGTRHRAGIGITEQSDALALIVSEETGTISLAQGGKVIRHLDAKTLREMLYATFRPRLSRPRPFWTRGVGS